MGLEREEETYALIGAAMEVHGYLGKGYLEAVYQEALTLEFQMRNIPFVVQPRINLEYKGRVLSHYYIPDFICFGDIPVELKAHSEPLSKADMKQILNSLRACSGPVGLIFNFGRASLDHKRVVL